MEPVTTLLSSAFILQKLYEQLIKDQVYGRFQKLLFPKKRYGNRLNQLINQTKSEYLRINKPKLKEGEIGFYQSQIFFDHLAAFILFKSHDHSSINDHLKNNPNIVIPTEAELTQFFSLFAQKVNSDRELKKLHIEENFKAEIFEISKQINEIKTQLDDIDTNVQRLVEKIDPSEIPVLTKEYTDRDETDSLAASIDSQSILLLTGVSFCGKSQLAKKIAARFTEKGYDYSSRSDIGEAERFLRTVSEKPRIFVLEDPFGHSSESEEPNNWRKVEELVQNLNTNNKLIITSRIEILKSVRKVTSLDKCTINGHEWFDLTISNKEFLQAIWPKMCVESGTSEDVRKIIESYLKESSEEYILQPGQLSHLSKMPGEKTADRSLEELLHLARQDAKGMSIDIQNRGNSAYRLFVALGLGATTNISIGYEELLFMLSDTESFPSIIERKRFRKVSFNDESTDAFPEYESFSEMSEELLMELNFLQTRGFIQIENKRIWFKHPTYREASRFLMLDETIPYIDYCKVLMKKGLSCLDPNTALNTLRQLKFIYKASDNSDIKECIRHLAVTAAWQSIFPSVKDTAFSFILEIIQDLSQEVNAKIVQHLNIPFGPSIHWHGSIPFIHEERTDFFNAFRARVTENPNTSTTLEKLNNNDTSLPLYEIWRYLQNMKHVPDIVLPTNNGALQILGCAEAFIRGDFALQLLKRSFPEEQNILKAIFMDEHPAVVFEGIKGIFAGWGNYSADQRSAARSYILEAFNNPMIIARSNNLISSFGIDYGSESIDWDSIAETEKGTVWSLWAELFIQLLGNYPEHLQIPNSGRLSVTITDSIQYLRPEQNLAVCKAYLNWITRQLEKGLLDTHEMAILTHLIDSTETIPDSRYDLFEQIFLVNDTGFLTYTLSWSMSYWEKMTEKEQQFILKFLTEPRPDQRWIRASCLTPNKLPKPVVQTILGNPDFFEQPVKDIVHSLDNELLNDGLSVYCGHPQPLWWIGIHHSGDDIWFPIMQWILENEHETGFDISLREMIQNGTNGFDLKWKPVGQRIWKDLCSNSINKKRLAERLIITTSETTCSIPDTRELWSSLIESYSSSPNELADLIALNLVALQAYNPGDLIKFLGGEYISEYIVPQLELDRSIIRLYNRIDMGDIVSDEDVSKEIEDCLTHNGHKITLHITKQMLDHLIQDKSEVYPRLLELKDIPTYGHEESDEKVKEFDDHYELDNWISLQKI